MAFACQAGAFDEAHFGKKLLPPSACRAISSSVFPVPLSEIIILTDWRSFAFIRG